MWSYWIRWTRNRIYGEKDFKENNFDHPGFVDRYGNESIGMPHGVPRDFTGHDRGHGFFIIRGKGRGIESLDKERPWAAFTQKGYYHGDGTSGVSTGI